MAPVPHIPIFNGRVSYKRCGEKYGLKSVEKCERSASAQLLLILEMFAIHSPAQNDDSLVWAI
jgi:hypothetical protein